MILLASCSTLKCNFALDNTLLAVLIHSLRICAYLVLAVADVLYFLDSEVESELSCINYWEELQCGVYSLTINSSHANGCLSGNVRKHEWTNPLLHKLIRWERKFVEPKYGDFHSSSCPISATEDNILPAPANGIVF